MLTGMTGFGQGVFENKTCKITAHIQSVNRKYCEITVNLPRELASLETKISRMISKKVQRGYLTVNINVETFASNAHTIQINKSLIKSYLEQLTELEKEIGVGLKPDMAQIMRLPDAVYVRTTHTSLDPSKLWTSIQKAIAPALEDFCQMRQNEGKQILKELTSRLNKIEKLSIAARKHAAQLVKDFKTQLKKNLKGIEAEGKGVDNAVEKEIISYSEKINTSEEVKRLEIHIKHFRQVMNSTKMASGRKLDFITQEINREINTLSAKSNSVKISRMAVDVKSELDKIREQLQNVE